MTSIFISYRRQDSAPYAGRLCDELMRAYGRSSVFMDVDTIQPGEAFADVVVAKIRQSDVVLALIGPGWLNATDDTGRRRLDRPSDFVRLEIASALAQRIRLIPVLLNGATMPSAQRLPDDLGRLPGLHAFEITDLRFRRDIDQLIGAIDGGFGTVTRLSLACLRHRFVLATVLLLMLMLSLFGIFGTGDWLLRKPPVNDSSNTRTEKESSRLPANVPPNGTSRNTQLSTTSGPFGTLGTSGTPDLDVSTMALKRQIDKLRQIQDLLTQAKRPVGTVGVRLDKSPHGLDVYVASLIDEGPAYDAGLRAGDVIAAVDGNPTTDLHDIELLIMTAMPGSTMMLAVRRGQRDLAFPIVVGKMGDADILDLQALITDRADAVKRKYEKATREAVRQTNE